MIESGIDEDKVKAVAKTPRGLVRKLAMMKARAVEEILKSKGGKDYVIIGADSTAAKKMAKGWVFFDKPKNKQAARKMFLFLKGKKHKFFTGLVVIGSSGKIKTKVSVSNVYFRNFSDKIMNEVLASGIWKGRAGGYDIDKDKSRMIKKTEGSYSNILGLPLEELIPILRELGVKFRNKDGRTTPEVVK